MLIEFRVRNYRSFRDEVTLSLVASSDPAHLDSNTTETNIGGVPRALRSAVLYGANASGKSNLLRGLALMRGLVVESAALQPGHAFNVQSFRLDPNTAQEPTLFEVTIALDGIRYQYGFEVTPTQVIGEWLLVYQKQKAQRWFERRFDKKSGKDKFEFGSHFIGQRRLWQEATRSNALFLSTAVSLNSEQLRSIFSWFAEALVIAPEGAGFLPFYSTAMISSKWGEHALTSFMSAADIAISSITAVPQKGMFHHFNFDFATGKSDSRDEESEILVPRFQHRSGNHTAEFDFTDESQGTQKLFSLAGPLFDILEKGRVLVIDELDRSLHPLLVRRIIETFQDSQLNRSNAQLIFSTHDTSLLDQELLRRDQIWFTEKDRSQSSTLVPLTEFSPRKGEAIEKGYLGGRYGGIPILARRLLEQRDRGAKK
jgi:AAA15 family ATPase/GTPase